MTSNFCKTSWHPYGHTPEECPDCRLCHESKIPKKLEFRPHLTTGVIARDRDMEMLVLWLNELRDYLQAKEEASKREFNRGFDEGEKFGRISERMYPESKGGCKQCMSQCRECVECRKNPNPPEHEERLEESNRLNDLAHKFNNTIGIKSGRDQKIVKFYELEIKSGYVSKEKIKREIKNLPTIGISPAPNNMAFDWVKRTDLIKSLGLGD